MQSLRLQLLLSTTLTGAIVLTLLGVSVYAAMRHALMKEFDASLRSDAKVLASMIQRRNDGHLRFDFEPGQLPDFL